MSAGLVVDGLDIVVIDVQLDIGCGGVGVVELGSAFPCGLLTAIRGKSSPRTLYQTEFLHVPLSKRAKMS